MDTLSNRGPQALSVAGSNDAGNHRYTREIEMADGLPTSGLASTYADHFDTPGRLPAKTATGEAYTHLGYTAALLPRARWYAVPMGTKLQLECNGRQVVVRVNDRGAGDGTMARVLDLSRAAYAYLAGVASSTVTDRTAGMLQLTLIEQVPEMTAPGPVKRSS
jgi:rare lipoprotein A